MPTPRTSSRRPFHRRSLYLAAAAVAAVLAVTAIVRTVLDDGDGARGIEAAAVPQAVIAQFEDEVDTLYVAPLDNVEDRRQFASIAHERGWGIIAAVSPDGQWLAYNVLPPGSRDQRTQARAHILSLTTGADREVAAGIDLQVAPVWSRDSGRAAFVRGRAPENELGSFTVLVARTSGAATEAGTIDRALGVQPAGFARDGAVYVAVLEPTGTRLESVAGGRRSGLGTLSSGIARDFALSPDGQRLAYVDTHPSAAAALSVRVFELSGGLRAQALHTGTPDGRPAGPSLGPAWMPDGRLTVGSPQKSGALVFPRSELSASSATGVTSGEPQGFDVPLAWSQDGAGLAVRAITGDLGSVRGQKLALVSGDGGRRTLGNADTKFFGWVPAGVGR